MEVLVILKNIKFFLDDGLFNMQPAQTNGTYVGPSTEPAHLNKETPAQLVSEKSVLKLLSEYT